MWGRVNCGNVNGNGDEGGGASGRALNKTELEWKKLQEVETGVVNVTHKLISEFGKKERLRVIVCGEEKVIRIWDRAEREGRLRWKDWIKDGEDESGIMCV